MELTKTTKRALWRPLAAVALVTGLTAPLAVGDAALAQETLPAIAAAAPESSVLFHAMDLNRDGAQWQQTEALLARVGVPDALALWEEAILEESEGSGDVTQADLDALLGGEMAIAVLPAALELIAAMAMEGIESDTTFRAEDATPTAASEETPLGVVAILRPGDPDAAWEYVEGQVADLAAQQDVVVEESSYGDAEVLLVPSGDKAGQAGTDAETAMDGMDDWMGGHDMYGSGGFVTAYAGDYIVAAMTEADVTSVVDVIDGTSGSLADSPEAQSVAAELPAEVLSFTYINGQSILETLDPEVIAMLQTILMDVPVESLRSQAGVAISADDPGFRFDTITILNDAVDLDSITVENDPSVAAAAERAPAGTFGFQAGRIAESSFQGLPYALAQAINAGSGSGSLDEQPSMFPTEEEMEAEIATAAATLEFDPQADLFDLLGDEFIAFTSFPSISFDNFGVDAVAAITTTDADALAETARKSAAWIERSAPNTDVSVRRVGEETVYVVSDSQTEGVPGIEFGVVGDQAVIGIGGGIEALMTPPADSLAGDAQFQTVMDLLPGEYYQVGYLDIGQAIDPIIMIAGVMGMMDGSDSADADLACTDYETQELAQAAYDADAAANANLDLDFDGQACEDAFAAASGTPMTASGDPRNIRALGGVAFQQENVMGASAILYIADGG